MAGRTALQVVRGTAAQIALYIALAGEPVWNVTSKTLHVGDGTTKGGVPLARQADLAALTTRVDTLASQGVYTPEQLVASGAVADALAAKADLVATGMSLAGKAPLNSPALTGTPTAPTPAAGDSSKQLATTEFVQSAIASGGSASPIDPDFLFVLARS